VKHLHTRVGGHLSPKVAQLDSVERLRFRSLLNRPSFVVTHSADQLFHIEWEVLTETYRHPLHRDARCRPKNSVVQLSIIFCPRFERCLRSQRQKSQHRRSIADCWQARTGLTCEVDGLGVLGYILRVHLSKSTMEFERSFKCSGATCGTGVPDWPPKSGGNPIFV